MGHICHKANCTNVSWFTSHVRSCENYSSILGQVTIIWDAVTNARMMQLFSFYDWTENRPTPRTWSWVACIDNARKSCQHIQLAEYFGKLFHDGEVTSDHFIHFFQNLFFLLFVLFLQIHETFTIIRQSLCCECDFILFWCNKFILGIFFHQIDWWFFICLKNKSVTDWWKLLYICFQFTSHFWHMLLYLFENFGLLFMNNTKLFLCLRLNMELWISAFHDNILLNHFADSAQYFNILFQLDQSILYLLFGTFIRETFQHFSQSLDSSIDFDEIIDFNIILLARFHFVKHIVEVVKIWQLLQLVENGVFDNWVLQEESYLLQSLVYRVYILKWLPHPPFQASCTDLGFAFIQNLEYCVRPWQDLLLHVLGEDLQSCRQYSLIQFHKTV